MLAGQEFATCSEDDFRAYIIGWTFVWSGIIPYTFIASKVRTVGTRLLVLHLQEDTRVDCSGRARGHLSWIHSPRDRAKLRMMFHRVEYVAFLLVHGNLMRSYLPTVYLSGCFLCENSIVEVMHCIHRLGARGNPCISPCQPQNVLGEVIGFKALPTVKEGDDATISNQGLLLYKDPIKLLDIVNIIGRFQTWVQCHGSIFFCPVATVL